MRRALLAILVFFCLASTSFAYRCVYSETARNSTGDIIVGATVHVYLADAGTAATIYETLDAASSVSSVSTESDGSFLFYVDRFDYDSDQTFKIIITKGTSTKTYDDVTVNRVVLGTYTLTADKTLSTNIHVPEGVLYDATGFTLTVSGTITAGLYQIFTGTGTVAGLKHAYPEWFGTDHDAFDQAIAASKSVELTDISYTITNYISVASSVNLFSRVGSEIVQSTSAKAALYITASNVIIDGIKITGKQYAAAVAGENGIYAKGVDTSDRLTNIEIKNCNINSWGYYGIITRWVDKLKIHDNEVNNIYYTGIGPETGSDINVSNNRVLNINGSVGASAYGIAVSSGSMDISTDPYPTDIVINGNYVYNVSEWEGIDIHFAERAVISNNVIHYCKTGIGIAGVATMHDPKHISITGNTIARNGLAAYNYGIAVGGISDVSRCENITVTGNSVDGYGPDVDYTGALYFVNIDALTVSGNTITNSRTAGIVPKQYVYDATITGNTIKGITGGGTATVVGGITSNTTVSGHIEGNYIDAGTEKAIYIPAGAVSTGLNFGPNTLISSHATGPVEGCAVADIGRGLELFATAVWNPDACAAAASVSTTVTIHNVQIGDYVQAMPGVDAGGLIPFAYVSAGSTVTYGLFNPTGDAINLASSTWAIKVTRR